MAPVAHRRRVSSAFDFLWRGFHLLYRQAHSSAVLLLVGFWTTRDAGKNL